MEQASLLTAGFEPERQSEARLFTISLAPRPSHPARAFHAMLTAR